jgi:hypothetical protein
LALVSLDAEKLVDDVEWAEGLVSTFAPGAAASMKKGAAFLKSQVQVFSCVADLKWGTLTPTSFLNNAAGIVSALQLVRDRFDTQPSFEELAMQQFQAIRAQLAELRAGQYEILQGIDELARAQQVNRLVLESYLRQQSERLSKHRARQPSDGERTMRNGLRKRH